MLCHASSWPITEEEKGRCFILLLGSLGGGCTLLYVAVNNPGSLVRGSSLALSELLQAGSPKERKISCRQSARLISLGHPLQIPSTSIDKNTFFHIRLFSYHGNIEA